MVISLREYGYSVAVDKEYRLLTMRECLDRFGTSEFVDHCLYVGRFQETVLDDLLSLNITLNNSEKNRVLELKRKHGYHEGRLESKRKIEDLENERDKLLKRVSDLDWKADRVDFMEQYARLLRKKIGELQKDVERLSIDGEERVHGPGEYDIGGHPKRKKILRRYYAM